MKKRKAHSESTRHSQRGLEVSCVERILHSNGLESGKFFWLCLRDLSRSPNAGIRPLGLISTKEGSFCVGGDAKSTSLCVSRPLRRNKLWVCTTVIRSDSTKVCTFKDKEIHPHGVGYVLAMKQAGRGPKADSLFCVSVLWSLTTVSAMSFLERPGLVVRTKLWRSQKNEQLYVCQEGNWCLLA